VISGVPAVPLVVPWKPATTTWPLQELPVPHQPMVAPKDAAAPGPGAGQLGMSLLVV
jgi:hypothetical protein